MSSGYAIKMDGERVVSVRAVAGPELATEDYPEGLTPDEVFWPIENGPPPMPTESPEVQEAAANALLESKLRQANAQVTALQGRVDTINYMVNTGDPEHPDYLEPDDPDYIAPTPEELAELPVRKAQLKAWNTYRTKLGRVKAAAGWYQTPAWPIMPEPYTSETSASPVQAS